MRFKKPPTSTALAISCFLITTAMMLYWSHQTAPMTELEFGFGPYIESLNQGKYSIFYKDSTLPSGSEFFATRLPALPLLAFLLGKIYNSLLLLSLVKNSLAALFTFYAGWRITQSSPKWVKLSTPLLLLSNIFIWKTVAPLPYEEGYLVGPFLLIVSAILEDDQKLSRIEPFLVGFALAWIYLAKSSYFLLLLPLLAMYCLKHKRSVQTYAIPASLFLISILSWGLYVKFHTGRFAVLNNASSLNASNLYKGNNKNFLDFYPYRNLDEMHDLGLMDLPHKVKTEWEYSDGLMKEFTNFRSSEPELFKKGLIEKAKMVFLKLDGAKSNEPESKARRIDKYFLFNRIHFFIWLSVTPLCLFLRKGSFAANLSFIGLGSLLCISLPYIIGFYYHRHLLPVFTLATLSLPTLIAELLTQRRQKLT